MRHGVSIVGVFCEDVREEIGGTHTVVGVLPENIDFPAWPATFSRLCLYVRFLLDPTVTPGPISVDWLLPDGTIAAKVELEPIMVNAAREDALANKTPSIGFISKFVASPLRLGNHGRIQAVAHVGDESFVCGSLYVNVKVERPAT